MISVIQGTLGLGLLTLGATFIGMGIAGKIQPPGIAFLMGFVTGTMGWILLIAGVVQW